MHINWKKTFIITADVVLGAYIVAAFVAFDKPNVERRVCTKVNINIKDEATNGFITPAEIKTRLENQHLYPLSKEMSTINGRLIEETLEQSPFVRNAECYKTEDGHVTIQLTQRMPILRIKAASGADYYIDDNHSVMPNSSYTSDLIIATGHVSPWFAQNYIACLAEDIAANDFWRNQIVQINVLPDKGIELVPRVGDHVVYVGHLPESKQPAERSKLISQFIEKKLNRLQLFYKYGLPQAGWNKYSYINIEFDNQIICKKHKENKNNTM